MKKAGWFSVLTIFLLVPGTLLLARHLPGRLYYITATAVIVEIMLPFFAAFEARRPQPRELVTLAVMAALAAVSRAAFAFLPYCKPLTGIVMLTAVAFGPEAGFLTGAMAIFASNFFFSQGPWTPWQMFAYGMAGFLAGLVFHGRPKWQKPVVMAVFGFLSLMLIVGPMLDSCTVFTVLTTFTWKSVAVIYGQGVPVNFVHGLSTALTILILGRPLLRKLERLQTKYGMLETDCPSKWR